MSVSADNSRQAWTRGKNLLGRALDCNENYRGITKQIGAMPEEEIESGIRRGDYHIDFLIRILLAQVVMEQFALLLAGKSRCVEVLAEKLHLARRICKQTSLKTFVKTDIADKVFALPVKHEDFLGLLLSARNRCQQRHQNE